MWVEAGFSPDLFWLQTPATFQLAMQGVRKRLERENDDRLRLAWETAAMSAAAQANKLKPLKYYLGQRNRKKQTPTEMLAVFRAFQANGAGMTIRRVELASRDTGR